MNSYEAETQEFRPKPASPPLFLFGVVSFLLADLIQATCSWGIQTILAFNSGWKQVLIMDVPILTDPRSPFYVSPPLRGPWESAGEILAGAFLALSAALVFFWPTRTVLASRLFVQILAIVFIVKGGIANPLARTDLLRTSDEMSQMTAIITIGIALALLMAAQRQILVVLQQFWSLARLSERARLFALLEIPGLLLLAPMYWINGFPAGSVAMALAFVSLFVVQTLYAPRRIYEKLGSHELGGAIAAWMVLLVLGYGASVWAFGLERLGRPRRAITWSEQRGLRIQTHESILREQLREPDGEKEGPRIRWSKDR